MTPLPVNPTVVVLVDDNGNPLKVASNISDDLTIIATRFSGEFNQHICNKPFVKDVKNEPIG